MPRPCRPDDPAMLCVQFPTARCRTCLPLWAVRMDMALPLEVETVEPGAQGRGAVIGFLIHPPAVLPVIPHVVAEYQKHLVQGSSDWSLRTDGRTHPHRGWCGWSLRIQGSRLSGPWPRPSTLSMVAAPASTSGARAVLSFSPIWYWPTAHLEICSRSTDPRAVGGVGENSGGGRFGGGGRAGGSPLGIPPALWRGPQKGFELAGGGAVG